MDKRERKGGRKIMRRRGGERTEKNEVERERRSVCAYVYACPRVHVCMCCMNILTCMCHLPINASINNV